MKNNELLIDGEAVTQEKLLNASNELIKLSEILELTIMVLEDKGYLLSKGDEFALMYFLKAKGLERIEDTLNQVNKTIVEVSNSICPDLD